MDRFLNSFRAEVIESSRNRDWRLCLLFLAWFTYIFVRHISDPMYNSIMGWFNLGIHELGHIIFAVFGQFISVTGGTILQCLVPLIGIINFYRQRDFFGIVFCFGWLSTNFFDVARYVSDARKMELPLAALFGNENVIHDWNYLLGRLGVLRFDSAIGSFVRLLAILSMLTCLLSGAWLIWQITKEKS